MYAVTVINPEQGDYQTVVSTSVEVAELLDSLEWGKVLRVIVVHRK